MRTRTDGAVLIAIAFTVAGCSLFKPQADPSRFYVLTSTASQTEDVSSRSSSGLTIGLGPIKFPDYLARSQLVTRLGPNRVAFSDFERWAEPLERNFSRIMIENLVQLLDTERVIAFPALVPISVQYDVPIEVQRFEGDGNGNVELEARWVIRAPADDQVFSSGETHISEAGGTTTEEVVAALSRAAGKLSERIANDILRLSKRSP